MTKNAGNRMLATFNNETLNAQTQSILGFYYPQCINHDDGGYYQHLTPTAW
jgi:mannose/cellobiose epimerase-like protein (N-acyl-D-glucosamine 2-epimerase family)